jgi:hypothetical protein
MQSRKRHLRGYNNEIHYILRGEGYQGKFNKLRMPKGNTTKKDKN